MVLQPTSYKLTVFPFFRFKPVSGQVDKASAAETVNSGSIVGRAKQ